MSNRIKVQFRRKAEGKTNYYKRLELLKADKIRLVIRKSLKHLVLQLVEYSAGGDKIITSYNTKSLEKLGWKYSKKNLSAAYLGGLMIGKTAQSKNIKEAILDCGLQTSVKGSRIYAALKGAIDAGLNVPCNKDILPSEERLAGKHIIEYLGKIKGKDVSQLSSMKDKDPETISKDFLAIKEKIIKGN